MTEIKDENLNEDIKNKVFSLLSKRTNKKVTDLRIEMDVYDDLEFHNFDLIEITEPIEKYYNIEFTLKNFLNLSTIKSIIDMTERKVKHRKKIIK